MTVGLRLHLTDKLCLKCAGVHGLVLLLTITLATITIFKNSINFKNARMNEKIE